MSVKSEPPRRIFVYELITGGGLYSVNGAPLPSGSLLREGLAMLSAVVEDFAAIPGTNVTVLRDHRLEPLAVAASEQLVVDGADSERESFCRAASQSDATLIIAPEFDQLLLERTRWAEQQGAYLLSPDSQFVALASCKWRTFEHFRKAGVPTIDTFFLGQKSTWQHLDEVPVVTKPRDGAGSEGIVCWKKGKQANWQIPGAEKILIQPKVLGTSVSCAVLGSGEDFCLLPAGYQQLDKELKYYGGRLPLPPPLIQRAHRLTTQAIRTLPPFRGYIGLDMILGPCPDAKDDVVVEINPRLTSSYVGLRKLLSSNLAQSILDVAAGIAWVPECNRGDIIFEFR